MSNPIKAVMLVTGEELIGELKERVEQTDVHVFRKPRVVAVMRNNTGQQGLALVPWTKSDLDATVEINKSQCVSQPFDPIQEIKAAYLQETSGIQLASSLPPSGGNGGSIMQ